MLADLFVGSQAIQLSPENQSISVTSVNISNVYRLSLVDNLAIDLGIWYT